MPDPALEPSKILVFPAWRDNPYLNTLYLDARARGYQVLETTTLPGLVARLAGLAESDVLHVHWTAPVVQKAETEAEALDRLETFRTAIAGAKERGVSIVWTVHNVLPHDAKFVETEIALCRFIADEADIVHTLSKGTPEMTAPFYRLDPAKIVRIPHPSYQGTYTMSGTRRLARQRFGLGATDRAVLFFGQMRPYKGLGTLFAALSAIAATTPEHERPVLLMAGKTTDEDLAAVEQQLPEGTRVVRHHGFVDDAEVEDWFRAADVAVFPYAKVLNSGSVHLAATFGVPVVLPGEPHLRDDFEGEGWVHYFDQGDPVGSIAAILADPGLYHRDTTASDFSRRLSPYAHARAYADALDARERHAPQTSLAAV